MLKSEIGIVGIDDSSFDRFTDTQVMVIGTMFRGGQWLDGVMSTHVDVDGDDATEKIVKMINRCKFRPQLQCVMLDGIAVGGFNVVDIVMLHQSTKIPVLVVMRDYPDIAKIKKILQKMGDKSKIGLLDKAGEITKMGNIHFQRCGMSLERAKELLEVSCTRSFIPEPIRVAHLIGQGVSMGESKGRA